MLGVIERRRAKLHHDRFAVLRHRTAGQGAQKNCRQTEAAGEGTDKSVSKTGFGTSPFRTRQRQYAWQNDLELDRAGVPGRLTLALERREERVDTDPEFAVRTRDTNSITAVYAVAAGPQALQANVRNDDSSQFGNRTTGALAYGYRIAPQWRVTVAGGTAFKAPTFNDLYFPGFSNPDLRPETAHNVEADVHYAAMVGATRVEARALAWHNRVRDLIVFQCDVNFNCAPANVNDATLKGVTLGADMFAGGTTLRASMDLQSPEDDATGHLLPRRARRHGSVQWLRQAGPVTFGTEVVASSKRFDDAANTRPIGGYGILNLTVEWLVARGMTLFARADNVLDRNYQLAADFSTGAFQRADTAKQSDCDALVARAVREFGGVDILVNNAGLQHVAPVEEFPVETWERLVRVIAIGHRRDIYRPR